MLQLVFGRAGSGKTTYARDLLRERALAGAERLFFLVPEQYSFESERALHRALGARCLQVEVLSFTRLTDRVQREYGGMAGERLTESGRVLLMSQALERVGDSLRFYRRQTDNSEFVSLLLRLSLECKMSGVEPARLLDAAMLMPEGTLQQKAWEIGTVLSEFEALVSGSFVDPQDDLTRLKTQLEQNGFFRGATVVIDGFKGFTAQEYGILELILAQADECVVTLCTDQLNDPEQGMGLFSGVRKTARRLTELARRRGAAVAVPLTLESGARFEKENLRTAEAQMFRLGKREETNPDGSIVLASALNVYEESRWIARTILQMVRSGAYRCRDFAVIVRQEEQYAGILDETLRRYGIPCFLDMPRPIDDSPLAAYVLSAVETLRDGLENDSLFRWLKTGLFGFSAEEIAALENYVFVWDLNRSDWQREWVSPPDGFSDGMAPEDSARLRELNRLRERVCQALLPLREQLRSADGRSAAAALYGFLEKTNARKQLARSAEQLRADGREQAAEDQLRVWDLMMEVLDQLASVLGTVPMDTARLLRLLQLSVAQAELGHLPRSLDEVTVGGAERIRLSNPRVVFVAGANQGVFPAPLSGGLVFSEEDRRQLDALGITLSQSGEEDAVEERFLAYTSLCSASQQLLVSWVQNTLAGESAIHGEIVTQLRSIFPALSEQSCRTELQEPLTAGEAMQMLAEEYRRPSPRRSALERALAERPEQQEVLELLRRSAAGVSGQIGSRETAEALFGREMRLSPSRVEKYYQCAFQYFCQYGMRAQPRRQAKIDALEYGTMIHFVLEQVLRERKERPITEQELPSLTGKLLEEYLESRLGGREGKSERFLCLYERFERLAAQLLKVILQELDQCEFVPEDFELTIGAQPGEDGIPALRLPLPGGGSIEVIGKVDRVDVMRTENGSFVRVIDYKTGIKKFSLRDVLYGLNMQMLIYLMTIWKNGAPRYGDPLPAGILYMPAHSPDVKPERGDTPETAEGRRLDAMRMSGLLLEDSRSLDGMDPQHTGLFLPLGYTKSGYTASSQLISLERMGKLARRVEKKLQEMGEQLQEGRIPPEPVEDNCKWCPFKAVCGRDPAEPGLKLPSMKNPEVFQRLDEDED